jgi:hypothetical protein
MLYNWYVRACDMLQLVLFHYIYSNTCKRNSTNTVRSYVRESDSNADTLLLRVELGQGWQIKSKYWVSNTRTRSPNNITQRIIHLIQMSTLQNGCDWNGTNEWTSVLLFSTMYIHGTESKNSISECTEHWKFSSYVNGAYIKVNYSFLIFWQKVARAVCWYATFRGISYIKFCVIRRSYKILYAAIDHIYNINPSEHWQRLKPLRDPSRIKSPPIELRSIIQGWRLDRI